MGSEEMGGVLQYQVGAGRIERRNGVNVITPTQVSRLRRLHSGRCWVAREGRRRPPFDVPGARALVSHAVHVALTAAHTPVCDRRGGCLTTECVPAGTPASAHVTSVRHMTQCVSLARRVDGVATPTAPHAIRSRVTDAPHTRSSSHLTTPVSTSQVCCCFWRCRPPSSVRRWNSRLLSIACSVYVAATRRRHAVHR